MTDLTVDDLKQRLLSLDLLDMGRIRDVENSFGTQNFTTEQFLQSLQRFGYLTKYQAERLISDDATGFYYGDYRVQYLVGAGSFARVFRCVHKTSGKVVAVKVLRARFRDDKTAIDEFIREAELGHELRHPNVAAVYEWASTKYDHYMVMDFVEGRTLREEVGAQKNGRVEPKRATRIVTDVCSALDYAAKRGYQHRDMKLSNIMLSSSGKAVLLDFGLLADEGSDFKTQRAIEYAALERTTRVRRDDKRSDVYFLGAIYYQLLAGIAPLGEIKERARRLDSSRFKNVKPIREVAPFVPRVLAFIVDKAMKLDPEERYQSPGAMLTDLEIAVKKLETGAVDEEVESQTSLAQTQKKRQANLPTVLVVEANPDLQNTFRQSFKNAGFRVLVTSNAERALELLEEPDAAIGAVLFNAQSLGRNAVEAFNRMTESPLTREAPAVLLLDENQVQWAAKAKRSKKRLAVGMPITIKRLILVVMRLTAPQLFEKRPDEAPAKPDADRANASADAQKKPESAASEPKFSDPLADATGPGAAAGAAPNVAVAAPGSLVDPEHFPADVYDAALEGAFLTIEAKTPVSPTFAVGPTPARPAEPNVDDAVDDEYYEGEDDEDANGGDENERNDE